MTVSLTRTVTFSAHHRFHVPDWSDDENRTAFGALGAAPGHGRHLNLVLPEFAYGKLLPTCEAMAAYLFPRLARRLPAGVHLDRVRLAEDATLYADCTGPTDAEAPR